MALKQRIPQKMYERSTGSSSNEISAPTNPRTNHLSQANRLQSRVMGELSDRITSKSSAAGNNTVNNCTTKKTASAVAKEGLYLVNGPVKVNVFTSPPQWYQWERLVGYQSMAEAGLACSGQEDEVFKSESDGNSVGCHSEQLELQGSIPDSNEGQRNEEDWVSSHWGPCCEAFYLIIVCENCAITWGPHSFQLCPSCQEPLSVIRLPIIHQR